MLKCIHVRKEIHFIWFLRPPIILILTGFTTFVHYYINPSEYFVQLNVVPTVLVMQLSFMGNINSTVLCNNTRFYSRYVKMLVHGLSRALDSLSVFIAVNLKSRGTQTTMLCTYSSDVLGKQMLLFILNERGSDILILLQKMYSC